MSFFFVHTGGGGATGAVMGAITFLPLLLASLQLFANRRGAQQRPPADAPHQDAGPGTSARSRTRASLSAVHKLRLEEFLSEKQLRSMTVHELLELLGSGRWPDESAALGRRRRDALSGRRLVREKEELVAEALRRRGLNTSTGETCGICLEDYNSEGCVLRALPCGHRFHVECVDGWLLHTSDACPYCSRRI